MKNWLYLIYIGLLGCLVSACQSSTEELPTPQQAKGTTSISLRLKLDGLGSRAATWEDNEYGNTGVVGSLSENEIDLKIFLKVLPTSQPLPENNTTITFDTGQVIKTRGGNSRSLKEFDVNFNYELCYCIE